MLTYFWGQALLCSPGWPRICCAGQALCSSLLLSASLTGMHQDACVPGCFWFLFFFKIHFKNYFKLCKLCTEALAWLLEPNLGLLKEQCVLLISEQSLQSLFLNYRKIWNIIYQKPLCCTLFSTTCLGFVSGDELGQWAALSTSWQSKITAWSEPSACFQVNDSLPTCQLLCLGSLVFVLEHGSVVKCNTLCSISSIGFLILKKRFLLHKITHIGVTHNNII